MSGRTRILQILYTCSIFYSQARKKLSQVFELRILVLQTLYHKGTSYFLTLLNHKKMDSVTHKILLNFCATPPHFLTGTVHLSLFEYKILKVLWSSMYSLLTSCSGFRVNDSRLTDAVQVSHFFVCVHTQKYGRTFSIPRQKCRRALLWARIKYASHFLWRAHEESNLGRRFWRPTFYH